MGFEPMAHGLRARCSGLAELRPHRKRTLMRSAVKAGLSGAVRRPFVYGRCRCWSRSKTVTCRQGLPQVFCRYERFMSSGCPTAPPLFYVPTVSSCAPEQSTTGGRNAHHETISSMVSSVPSSVRGTEQR